MKSRNLAAGNFDHHPDGLERTEWFNGSRHIPDRIGIYEVCAWKGADIVRCRWDGSYWYATARLADRITSGFWRGLTRKGHILAKRKSAA